MVEVEVRHFCTIQYGPHNWGVGASRIGGGHIALQLEPDQAERLVEWLNAHWDREEDAWHPYPETHPEHNCRALIYTAANNLYACWWNGNGWNTHLHDEVVTHWRHMPPRPKDNKPFVMTYSGLYTDTPVNIAARDGPVFQIHAENGEEVQRLVAYLNEREGEKDK